MFGIKENSNANAIGITKPFLGAISLLEKRDRTKLLIVTLIQLGLAFLDLVAVTLIGIVTAVSLSGIQSSQPPEQIQEILKFLRLSELSFQTQVAIIGLTAAIILVTKTIISIFLVRKILEFLSFKSSEVSLKLTRKFLDQNYEFIKKNSTQNVLYSITQGCNNLTVGVIGSTIQLIVEICLIVVMLIGLFIYEPIASFGALLYFGIIGILQQILLGKRAINLGSSGANARVLANKKIAEAIGLYREIFVRQVMKNYINDIAKVIRESAAVTARLNFYPYINKYTLETSLVIGGLVLSAITLLTSSAVESITTLAVFMAAASRISPALLRVQQSLIGIKANIGASEPTLILMANLKEPIADTNSREFVADPEFEIALKNVTFIYENSDAEAISNVSLEVQKGEMIALVGPSGSGKTTLVDLILGLLEPENGSIQIRQQSPRDFIMDNPGKISYVAQDAVLLDCSIRENLTFGLDHEFDDMTLYEVLKSVTLYEFVMKLPNKLDTILGERGSFLSGGQRQRLNLARALITNPELLVLDEATSALDIETEIAITQSIESIKINRTIIVIAHRLSTVLNSDKIIFLKDGKILGQGTFSELRKSVPDFDRQAQLAGYED